jgi:hypothetical protein
VTIFVTDMAVIDRGVQLHREFFTPPYPADTITQVASLVDPAWQIEIEAIAVVSAWFAPRNDQPNSRHEQLLLAVGRDV